MEAPAWLRGVLSARYVVRPAAWEELARRLEAILERSAPTPEDLARARREPDHLVKAVLGPAAELYSSLERRLVTRFGMRAHLLVEPFLTPDGCRPGEPPWSLLCDRRREDGGVVHLAVRVVLGPKTLNRQVKDELASTVPRGRHPLVLTLVGSFGQSRYRVLEGGVVWLDAPLTWAWLAGERGAYRRFLGLLYEAGRTLRARLAELLRGDAR